MRARFHNAYLRLRKSLGNSHSADQLHIPADAKDLHYFVDRFSIFQGTVRLAGWAFSEAHQIRRAFLKMPSGDCFDIKSYGLQSKDLAERYGVMGLRARFDEVIEFPGDSHQLLQASVCFELDNGVIRKIENFYGPNIAVDPAHQLYKNFKECLESKSSGSFLEIGARARSGIVRREASPAGWSYTGFDVLEGENVDVIGDAHKLSSYFPARNFDAVMAFSVLEHLLMPWKFIVELNRVMKVGAAGLFTTHQCWPLHDQPWDFWRFSAESWPALLNDKTGFQIIDSKMGEPSFVVANVCHPATNFGENSIGYLASTVFFQKTGETTLEWPVDLEDIISTQYPDR